MEQEQKIQNQDMEQGQKIQEQINQENQEEVKQENLIEMTRKIKLSHKLDDNEYIYSTVKICVEGKVMLPTSIMALIRGCKSIYIYSIDRPEDVISRIDGIIRELETDVSIRARNVIRIENKIRKYSLERGILLEVE